MAHEGVPLIVIQRQLGHTNLGITRSTYKASHADMRTTMGYIVGYHERGDEGASIEAAFASLPAFDESLAS
jgi:integrase